MALVQQDLSIQTLTPHIELSYEQAISMKKERVWNKLSEHSVGEAMEIWLATLSPLTAINYRSGMKKLIERRYIKPEMSLQAFSLENSAAIVDRIKKDPAPGRNGKECSECTRQARAACYISFTGFLSRRFDGMIKKASPCKEGTGKTFFRFRDKVNSQAMTLVQWTSFLDALAQINERDCLIAKIVLQGGKRINEVLSLTVDQISWDKNEITFVQSKTKGSKKETVITYSVSVMIALREYIEDRKDLVFVTATDKKVSVGQLSKTFEKAGLKASIPFKVTPHVLRASTVTYLKQQGFSDSDIMKVTGHASAEMVYAYDKSSRADNASKKVSLVQ